MLTIMDHINKKLAETPWREKGYNGNFWDREKLTHVVAAKRLETQAKDNHNNIYNVYLVMENLPTGWVNPNGYDDNDFRNKYCFSWVLKIDNTPASWCMTTLLERPHGDRISIDFGQKWDVINFREVLDEAKRLI